MSKDIITHNKQAKQECQHIWKEEKVERDFKYNPKEFISYLICRLCKMAGIAKKDL